MDMAPFIQGFGMGISLIMAIGAQNAFLLSQSIRQNHHIPVCIICITWDTILIALGVLGFGGFVVAHPQLQKFVTWGGIIFLAYFGLGALRSALKQHPTGIKIEHVQRPLKAVILTTLAVSILNPHVYLDTVVLLGSISTNYEGTGRYYFGMGAACGSLIWFSSLALCGKLLAPYFTNPLAWKILDAIVCLIVWSLATFLAWQMLSLNS